MLTEIYYFSGTGNSLYVARELQKRLPESDLVPIVRQLREDTFKTTADTVGLVFPNFCLTVPIPLHNFLKKVDVTSARYLFALCTRGGTPSDAFDYINALLKRQGRRLDAQINVTMPWNHPLGKENLPALATEERIAYLKAEMQRKLDTFSQHILVHETYLAEDTDADYVVPQWAKAMSSWIPKSSPSTMNCTVICTRTWSIFTAMRHAPAAAFANRSVPVAKYRSSTRNQCGKMRSSAMDV